VFIFFMRQLQIGGGKAMSFGKSKAGVIVGRRPDIGFKDVAGLEEAKVEIAIIMVPAITPA